MATSKRPRTIARGHLGKKGRYRYRPPSLLERAGFKISREGLHDESPDQEKSDYVSYLVALRALRSYLENC